MIRKADLFTLLEYTGVHQTGQDILQPGHEIFMLSIFGIASLYWGGGEGGIKGEGENSTKLMKLILTHTHCRYVTKFPTKSSRQKQTKKTVIF